MSHLLCLKHFGAYLSRRFQREPLLHDQQKEALKSLAEWFSDDHEIDGHKTKDFTAVVSMPTGSGKSGIICCLPYYLGGAKISCINFNKPILVIAPGLSILNQLEVDLRSNPFLMRLGLIKPGETQEYGFTVHPIKETADVKALQKAGRYDIVLTNAQKWPRDCINCILLRLKCRFHFCTNYSKLVAHK